MNKRQPGKMPCPICDGETRVYDTELMGERIRRKRRCENDHRFFTSEARVGQVWDENLRVVPLVADDYDEHELAAEVGGGIEV